MSRNHCPAWPRPVVACFLVFPLLLTAVVISASPEGKTPVAAQPLPKEPGFAVPEGFEVTLYADDALATDIFAMTIDARGRVVVASKNYIKTLHDTDGDGRADKATLFSDLPKSGAHGMYFDGDDLICDGDNGVRRLYDTDGDGKCDKVSPPWFATTKDGEHAANGIVRGPDGWYYLISGNDAGLDHKSIPGPNSSVKEPNAGVLLRFSPDSSQREVLADGFRNPYDLDFNPFGHVFTVDADGERVHQMPYYAPNRLFDIAAGQHHGWVLPGWQRCWSRPAWWPDTVERLVEVGRGSPTGVTVYRHRAFPEKYRNGVFSLCWTFGNIYFFPLSRDGSTYKSKKEVFMHTTGDVGFAPTDIAVGPSGDLFIAIGGRGTRGSVFRVHYTGPVPALSGKGNPLREVLAADQPLSSWSRAKWVPAAKKLGKQAFLTALEDGKLPLVERIRAVEIVTELFGGVPVELVKKVCDKNADGELTARVLWSLACTSDSLPARTLLATLTGSADPRIARTAWEGLLRVADVLDPTVIPNWKVGLNNPDRRVRALALAAAKGVGRTSFLKAYQNALEENLTARESLARLWVAGPQAKNLASYFDVCLRVVAQEKNPVTCLEAVRLVQIALGDVNTDEGDEKAFIGFVANAADKVSAKLRQQAATELARKFPSGNDHLDLELARTLAMLAVDVPAFTGPLAQKWTKQSAPETDIHYLLALAQIPGQRSPTVSSQTAAALNAIHVKLSAHGRKPTDQVPEILDALLQRLAKLDSKLVAALVADPAFGHPGHEMYAFRLPLPQKQAAARKLLAAIAKLDKEEARAAWNPELVQVVAALPDEEALPILRLQFDDPRLSDTIALILAKKRQPEDQARFIEALNSTQPTVVRVAAETLLELTKAKPKPAPLAIGKAVRALHKLAPQKGEAGARQSLIELLTHWTGQKLNVDPPGDPAKLAAAWVDWYSKTYPKEAATLPGLSVTSYAAWKKRLDQIDWDAGNDSKGLLVFQRKNCQRCHGDARRFGPDLTGVAQRFSRDDLFTAIIQPDKDISPAYQSKTIITTSGKIYNGMLIYESPVLTLLQTTPDTTVRIPQQEMHLMYPGTVSFMPSGLLDDLHDSELADLYAYLKTLRKK